MKNLLTKTFTLIFTIFCLTGCARDLSSASYTSDSTLNIALEGQVISAREIKIKESDRLGDNAGGALIGGVGGGVIAASSGGNNAAIAGAAVAGGVLGAVTQQALGTSSGIEYIVKVDTSKMGDDYYEGSTMMRNALAAVKATGIVTVIQARESKKDPIISAGNHVIVIVSEKRTRVILNMAK